MKRAIVLFLALSIMPCALYPQKLEDVAAGVLSFLLRNPKTANKMKVEEKIALDIISDILKTKGQRQHELEYAASGRSHIVINTNDGRQAQFVRNETGNVFLLLDGVIYPVAHELVNEALGRETHPVGYTRTDNELSLIKERYYKTPANGLGSLFSYKWRKDFDGNGAISFDEHRNIKKTWYHNENFIIAVPYRTSEYFSWGRVSLNVYNDRTGELVHTEDYSVSKNKHEAIHFEIPSNKLPIGTNIINARLIHGRFTTMSSDNIEITIVQGDSSTREISFNERRYRQSISGSTPMGLFFWSSWEDKNNNGNYDHNEFIGLNKKSYSLSKDHLWIGVNFPQEFGEIILQSLSRKGELLGATTLPHQTVQTKTTFPDSDPYKDMDFIDMIKIKGPAEYVIRVIFVGGGTYERKLVITE